MRRPPLRVAIDCTAAVRQGAGIGRYTRELVRGLLAPTSHPLHPLSQWERGTGGEGIDYILLAATGGLPDARRRILGTEPPTSNLQPPTSTTRWRPVPVTDRFLNIIWHRLRLPLPAELLTGPVDVFHSPDFTLPPLARARSLLTVHDLSFLRHPESAHPAQRAYLVQAVPRSVARADHVLADSQNTKTDLVELLGVPPTRVTVVYPGIEPRFQRMTDPELLAGVRARYHLPDRFILHVGTLQPRKNLVRLIEAFHQLIGTTTEGRRLKSETSHLKLVLVGEKGWLYQEIFNAVQRPGLAENVMFLGFVDDADLPAIYSLAELFVFPSLYEGFGLPVLEAMACGCPVVCSNASSLPEVAGDAALLVPPTDVDALTDAMAQVPGDAALRSRLIEAGYAQASRFTWEAAARQTRELYQLLAR
jgi:glycosyltransferase involved in cell wall biosynthesis